MCARSHFPKKIAENRLKYSPRRIYQNKGTGTSVPKPERKNLRDRNNRPLTLGSMQKGLNARILEFEGVCILLLSKLISSDWRGCCKDWQASGLF